MNLTCREAAICLDIKDIPEHWSEIRLEGCTLDSRNAKKNSLFVCIMGERVDGHDYARAAELNGCAAILSQKSLPDVNVPVLVVRDVVKALGQLANYWRKRAKAKVIAITGTAGKTTFKEILASIFSRNSTATWTSKNNNNQLGLPCSILNMSGHEDWWILETGISHPHDMDDLGAIIEPDLAVIINAGPGHNEGLGAQGVEWHKARILKYLRPGGIALINADYPELVKKCAEYEVQKVFFSRRAVTGAFLSHDNWKNGNYRLEYQGKAIDLKFPFSGEFWGEMAGLAATCACLCGFSGQQIEDGFENIKLPRQRFNFYSKNCWLIFDDTYNANPLSMVRMLDAANFEARKNNLKLFAVLGEMRELGHDSAKYHEELGTKLAHLEPEGILWTGDFGEAVNKGYQNAGGKKDIFFFQTADEFENYFREKGITQPGAIIFKGSRANGLENYLHIFETLPFFVL